jgi:hypothetical protein
LTPATAPIIMALMRGFMTAKSILVSVALAACAGLVASSGCKKKEEEGAASKPVEQDKAGAGSAASAQEEQKGSSRDAGARGLRNSRLGLEPLTVDEIKPLLPTLEGSTPLREPNTTARGLRVTAAQCVTGNMTEIRPKLEEQLKKLGFTTVRISERKRMNIMTVSAQKSPYRLSATVRSGPYPDCPEKEKKSKMLISYFKRPPRNAPDGSASGAAPAQGSQAAPGQGTTAPVPPPEGGLTPAAPEPTK